MNPFSGARRVFAARQLLAGLPPPRYGDYLPRLRQKLSAAPLVTNGDINRDGYQDLIAGLFWNTTPVAVPLTQQQGYHFTMVIA